MNFIANNSTPLSFIFGFLLLAVNYVSSLQVEEFQNKSIASQNDAKKFQSDSLGYQQEARDAQEKNNELIRDLLENASNPDLLSEKLLGLRTEWLKKMSGSSPVNPNIDHIIKAINEIKREKEEVDLTREENLSAALRNHELFAIPIWTIVSDVFYKRALLLQEEGILENVKQHVLEVDKTANESFYGQTHDFKDMVSAKIAESGQELSLKFSRELYPLSKDPKSQFGSISSFISFKKETQIVLDVTRKKIRISSPQSELEVNASELPDKMNEFSKIAEETFDDYLIQQLSR